MADNIVLSIPKPAVELMMTSIPTSAWTEMIQTGVISEMSLRTFAGIITPIIFSETGLIVGFVGHWIDNRAVSVTAKQENTSMLKLVDTYDWTKLLGPDKAVEIWEMSIEPFEEGGSNDR